MIISFDITNEHINYFILINVLFFIIYQYFTLKPKVIRALETVENADMVFQKQAVALNATIAQAKEDLQEQIQENVDSLVTKVDEQIGSIKGQVHAHVNSMQEVVSTQMEEAKKSIKTSLGDVQKTIEEVGSTGPVSSIVNKVGTFWENPLATLVIVTGCGVLIRQLYVKYYKEKNGKEGLKELTQSKVLLLFDAMLAMFIVPTLLTHGWKTATELWRAAKVGIEAIRTMVLGINLYQSLFGDDLKNQSIPSVDSSFEKALDQVERKVEASLAVGEKQAKFKIMGIHHNTTLDADFHFHCCTPLCKPIEQSHYKECDLSQEDIASEDIYRCICIDKFRLMHPSKTIRNGIGFVVWGFAHFEECDPCVQVKAVIDDLRLEESVNMIAGVVKGMEGKPTCACYRDGKMKTRDMYLLENMKKEEDHFMVKEFERIERIVKKGVEKPMISTPNKLPLALTIPNTTDGTIVILPPEEEAIHIKNKDETTKKIESFLAKKKDMETIVREEFNLPKTGVSDKVTYMFNYATKHPAFIPTILVLVFAIFLFFSWLCKPKGENKKWYTKRMAPYVIKARSQYANGEDYSKIDNALTSWVKKEGKGSDAKRKAARLLAKSGANSKRPWWDYDDDRDIADDQALYSDGDQEDPNDSSEVEDDFDIVDQIDAAVLNDETTVYAIQKKYGKGDQEGTTVACVKSLAGCLNEKHYYRKTVCSYPLEGCPHKTCCCIHLQCVKKNNVCLISSHRHTVQKKPKIVSYNLSSTVKKCVDPNHKHTGKQEAIHNGDRMQITPQMLTGMGWAKGTNYSMNATKVWNGVCVCSHIFGKDKPNPDDSIEISFYVDKDIKTSIYYFRNAKHISYDMLYWEVPFEQGAFKNRSKIPVAGQKVTMIAFDSYEDFLKQKPRVDIENISSCNVISREDNTGKDMIHTRCVIPNSTVDGNCAGGYYDAHGFIVGFHNEKYQTNNGFIGVDRNMVSKAAGSPTF